MAGIKQVKWKDLKVLLAINLGYYPMKFLPVSLSEGAWMGNSRNLTRIFHPLLVGTVFNLPVSLLSFGSITEKALSSAAGFTICDSNTTI
jgi:hypothetical protein